MNNNSLGMGNYLFDFIAVLTILLLVGIFAVVVIFVQEELKNN